MQQYDITLVTQREYVSPAQRNAYTDNVLLEDRLLTEALQAKGLNVYRTNWDDPNMDWSNTRTVLIRATWDYFNRAVEFSKWLDVASQQTQLINPVDTLRWNMDKHYLLDLKKAGVQIVPTLIIEAGDQRTLSEVVSASGWPNAVLKPAISGGARHTYVINNNIDGLESTYQKLIADEAMLLQPFQNSIKTKGEVSHMVFGGRYSHSVLKIAKPGDFRVQDDFGGTVHHYEATQQEQELAESIAAKVLPLPAYARVDVLWDNDNNIALAELELIEPELWFREHPKAATLLADGLSSYFG